MKQTRLKKELFNKTRQPKTIKTASIINLIELNKV